MHYNAPCGIDYSFLTYFYENIYRKKHDFDSFSFLRHSFFLTTNNEFCFHLDYFRLGTDISFGNRTGMKTLAVLSGVTSLKEIEELSQKEGNSELMPNFVADSVKDLLVSLEN